MEDRAIIDLYWSRNPEAIRRTDEKYGRYCRTVARNILPDCRDTEECVNDTWLKAWNAMPEDRPQFLAPFLGKITRNLALTAGGRAGRRNGAGESCPWSWTSWRSAFLPATPSRPWRRRSWRRR